MGSFVAAVTNVWHTYMVVLLLNEMGTYVLGPLVHFAVKLPQQSGVRKSSANLNSDVDLRNIRCPAQGLLE